MTTQRTKLNQARWEAGEKKRAALTELFREGKSVTAALAALGWTKRTYARYRIDDKTRHWAAIWDAAREEGKAHKVDGTIMTPSTFVGFTTEFFTDRRPHLPHQVMLANALSGLQPREIVMFEVWPESGKTAVIEDYINRKLAFDPAHRFRVVSESKDLAERIVGTVKRRMTDIEMFPRYIARYGPFYETNQERNGKPWGAQQISVYKNPGTERDRNLVASSWTSTVYGSRIDTLIIDDVCSQRSLNQSEEIFRRIRGTFLNRGLDLRVIIVGTRIGHGDFYERVLDAGLVDENNVICIPAAGGWGAEPGEPTVPEFWRRPGFVHDGRACCPPGLRVCPRNGEDVTAREFMELIKFQSGPEVWHSSYQQNPIAHELSTFGEALNPCLDFTRPAGVLV